MAITIKNYPTLSEDNICIIENFIQNNTFNCGISFTENSMNFYEDFPCFFMLYEQDILIGLASIFIPDSTSCEIYFHLSNSCIHHMCDIFKELYCKLEDLFYEYDLYNQYIIFEKSTTNVTAENINDLMLTFSHSECLMQYDISYNLKDISYILSHKVDISSTRLIVNTFLYNAPVGTCEVEIEGDYALIHDVEVQESYRGHGYGRETLFYTLKYLINHDFKKILLHVNSANTIAFTMYSHYGFNIIKQLDYYKL